MTLVLGAPGQLGTALRAVMRGATYLTRRDLDLTDITAIRRTLRSYEPNTIINCAAYTDVDGAETDEETATAVNATAVGELAACAAERGIPFVTFSTDYVFDGTGGRPYVESDAPNPINAYGRSKTAGEELALSIYPDTLVIRTSWLISGTGGDFVSKILARVREQPVKVVDDQRGCPTIVDDLAVATVQALGVGATGVVHLVNEGEATWHELAVAAADLAALPPDRISPCASGEFPTPAKRPRYSVLGSERRRDLRIEPLPQWRDSLTRVVNAFTGELSGQS